ncbi:hypothetical protein Mapa_004875 [Marchantia paleacea]|nr:hypothetical protein Mapa_004875 [Marchantia paleacea]
MPSQPFLSRNNVHLHGEMAADDENTARALHTRRTLRSCLQGRISSTLQFYKTTHDTERLSKALLALWMAFPLILYSACVLAMQSSNFSLRPCFKAFCRLDSFPSTSDLVA